MLSVYHVDPLQTFSQSLQKLRQNIWTNWKFCFKTGQVVSLVCLNALCIPLQFASLCCMLTALLFCICCIQSFAWNCLVSQRATFSSRGRRMKHQVCRPWKHQVCRLWNITPRIREESGTPTPTASCDENPSLLRLAWA